MMTSPTSQKTDFAVDVVGRYVCNGLDEALRSVDRSARPDARPLDIIVIGGGTFGSVLAQHLFYRDKKHSHRILVLEAGPFALPEHVQNLPMMGLGVPGATTIQKLRQDGQFGVGKPREELWGLPWHSPTAFPGLAFCVGGRSLFWGGWSPQLLDAEMRKSLWPSTVVADLSKDDFRRASEQIGVTETNDFIHGALHDALRERLFKGINQGEVKGAIPLRELPQHLDQVPVGSEELFKLEAPLAVQSRARSGFFPFNKFSAVPLLVKAARAAESECGMDDVKKRLMVVPNCHVKRLVMETLSGPSKVDRFGTPLHLVQRYVSQVETDLGNIPVPDGGKVILALATIESTRLAQLSFGGIPGYDLIGQNLMAHLRSNLTIRLQRKALAIDPGIKELQAAALFVKGRLQHDDGTIGHFHLQITAAGLDKPGTDSEAELFKKVPDIDGFEAFREADDQYIVITIRGIGEMEPRNPQSRVALDPEWDEYGVARAKVTIEPTDKDGALWKAMDQAAKDVAEVFAGGAGYEELSKGQDGLGTTHHETGTLWMGSDSSNSVTNSEGRFHEVSNVYVAGPALFPTIGSPNPMLTGIALARRLARHLIPDPQPFKPVGGFRPLFDGFTTTNWRMAGKGNFAVLDGTLESVPSDDLGLYWCTTPTPPDFVLKLEWLRWKHDDNSGVFIRFPNPESMGYRNPAYVAVEFGFEVQIDELGSVDIRRTGAIYNEPGQRLSSRPARPPGEWNEFEIRVKDQNYTVLLNGQEVTTFKNPHPGRGLAGKPGAPSFIGLQSYPGKRVAFRNIQIT